MNKHLRFAGLVVVCQFVLFVIWFPLVGLRAGATEHARMFNGFSPTTYDRVLEAGSYPLFAPVALVRWFIPNIFRGVEAPDIIVLFLYNSFVIAMAALLLSVIFHRFRNKKRNVRDNSSSTMVKRRMLVYRVLDKTKSTLRSGERFLFCQTLRFR